MATVAVCGDLPTVPEPEGALLLVSEWLKRAADEATEIADAIDTLCG